MLAVVAEVMDWSVNVTLVAPSGATIALKVCGVFAGVSCIRIPVLQVKGEVLVVIISYVAHDPPLYTKPTLGLYDPTTHETQEPTSL